MKTHLTFKTKSPATRKHLLLGWSFAVLFLFQSMLVFAQQNQVTGNLTDSDNNPIPGVSIAIKGTTKGTVSDLEGNFSIPIDSAKATLVITAIGYIGKEVEVTSNQIVNMVLEADLTELDEIVVIGYGSQKTSLVTGAISSLDNEDIEKTSSSRIEDVMQGKTPGVSITQESGSPGAGIKVRIRGTGTNGNANPLYIVDGIRMGNVNDISPADIESVEILKDAASTAIYGAEGGNGIVIITTKKGSKQEGKVNYSFSYGLQSVGKLPELLNADQYNQFQLERGFTPSQSTYNTNWIEEVFETAPMSTHNLSFSGGGEKTTYFSSFTYFNQDGIIGGDKANFKRFTSRLNVDHEVKSWLKVGTNLTYARNQRTSLNEDDEFGGIISSALLIDPYTPTHYSPADVTQGMQDLIDAGEPVRRDDDGRYFAISENVQGEMVNPFLQMDLETGLNVTDRVIGVASIEIMPLKGLTITSRPGIDFSQTNYHDWTPLYYYSQERKNTSLTVNDNIGKYYQWQWENFISYQQMFGSHNISAVLGMSAQESKDKFLNTNSGEMVREGDQYAEHDYTSDLDGLVSGNEFPNRLVSYFGRVSYDYKGKYMLQASLRNDKTSTTNVPLDGISGIFPSVSAGWTLSEEEFFPEGVVNGLKLRGSWGQNGSISSITSRARQNGQYLYTSTITSSGLRYPTSNGFIVPAEPGVLPNPDLTWETSEQTNFGLDLNLWLNRVNISADYFVKQTKDLLMFGQPPSTAGTNPAMLNAGDVENRGFEFNLGFRNNDKALKYHVNFNFTTLKNEVTKLNVPAARINGTDIGTGSWVGATAFEVGQPVWYFRGYETNGIDPATGDPIFVENGGDPNTITDEDRVYLGDPHPDFMFGATLSLEYKGFDLNIFLQGQTGHQVVYGWMRTDRLSSNMHTDFYEGRWTPTNTNATMPAADADPLMYSSDLMVKDGDYVRVKQIQLGYNLSPSLLENVKLSNMRIFISLDDYFTFTKYEGMDPEAGSPDDDSQGIDRGVYPTPRRVMFGLSVSF
ncbi:MAG: TonB-dependent receptor [Bacteroidota bacterium]|nr:MAG: TonB-dependent receptor [Bacteroidota bacterium]